MKLTCVTATFNCIKSGNRERLVRCVESVARLKGDHEHLVYDGASTDGTTELLRELERRTPGLKVVSEPDTGIYNALNKGVQDAKGEWFYVLGADDCIVSEDNMQSVLDEGESEKSDIVVTPVYTSEDCATKIGINTRNVIGNMPYPHQGMLIRTIALRTLRGFDEKYLLSADYDMVLRALDMGLTVTLDDDATFAVYSNSGVSVDNINITKRENLAVVTKHLVLSNNAALRFSERNLLPLRKCFWLLFRKSPAFRSSAKYYLLRWLANCLGLLRRNGTLIWH